LIKALGVTVHELPRTYALGNVAVILVVTSRVWVGTMVKDIAVDANIVGSWATNATDLILPG